MIRTKISRREAMRLLGAAGAVTLAGCNEMSPTEPDDDDTTSCVVTPLLTEGPFFLDQRLDRASIVGGQQGLPLELMIAVYNASEGTGRTLDSHMSRLRKKQGCPARGPRSDQRGRAVGAAGSHLSQQASNPLRHTPAMPPAFEPRNPDFEVLIRESFARQAMMSTLRARLVRVAPGVVDVELDFAPRFTQQNGFLHAGAIAAVADSANGYAAFTLAPPDTDVLAVEFKINLLAPARAGRFMAEGRVLRPGRTLTVCQAEVWGESDAGRELVAVMLSTIIVRPK